MAKLLVVFGATGQQGGSIVSTVLSDPELSKTYKLRAMTRDPSAASAQVLKAKGVEVVKGDVDDGEVSIFIAIHFLFLSTRYLAKAQLTLQIPSPE
jgi:uncharacterized protein YbjT (DUF2867 family)